MTPAHPSSAMAYPPTPCNGWHTVVWEEQRVRRRLMEGTWSYDLADALARELEQDRIDIQGEPDQSKNVARDLCTQSSALYVEHPGVGNASDPPAETVVAFRATLTAAGWRGTMDTAQPMILAQREGVIRVDPVPVAGTDQRQVRVRHVSADLCEAWPHLHDPTQVGALALYDLRPAVDAENATMPGYDRGDHVWMRETWDIRGTVPTYTIAIVSDAKGAPVKNETDVTREVAPNSAEKYPWVWEGRPYIPAVLYHAREGTGRLFDPFYGVELMRGSLRAAVGATMWFHAFKDASWPQRNAVDLEPAGGVKTSPHAPGIASITTDMTSILCWKSKGDKNGSLYQFQAGGDIDTLAAGLENYCASLVASYGISPTDVQRVAADPRSGYAIALSREGIRKEIARYRGTFATGDAEAFGVIARVSNTWCGTAYPVDGWTSTHRGLPKSPDEIKLEMEQLKNDVDNGIASLVDMYVQRHGVTRREAVKALERVAAEQALVRSFGLVADDVMGNTAPAAPPAPDNPNAPAGAPGEA